MPGRSRTVLISESCYKGGNLMKQNRKMTISWSFSYNSFVKLHDGKKNTSYNMDMLYPLYPNIVVFF